MSTVIALHDSSDFSIREDMTKVGRKAAALLLSGDVAQYQGALAQLTATTKDGKPAAKVDATVSALVAGAQYLEAGAVTSRLEAQAGLAALAALVADAKVLSQSELAQRLGFSAPRISQLAKVGRIITTVGLPSGVTFSALSQAASGSGAKALTTILEAKDAPVATRQASIAKVVADAKAAKDATKAKAITSGPDKGKDGASDTTSRQAGVTDGKLPEPAGDGQDVPPVALDDTDVARFVGMAAMIADMIGRGDVTKAQHMALTKAAAAIVAAKLPKV